MVQKNDSVQNRFLTTQSRMFVSQRTVAYRILLPLTVLLLCTVSGRAQQLAPAAEGELSAWWYPLGTPQSDRNNPVPTTSQQVGDLQFKWRTGRLKNSPVILVGGIRTQPGNNDQQIVGIEEGTNRVTILTSAGFVDTVIAVEEAGVLGLSLRLTGLFNTAAPTVTPTGKPNAIGVGIRDWPIDANSTPFGLLMDSAGKPINRLGLRTSEKQKLSSFTSEQNRRITISPVAAYTPRGETTPIAIALTSQEQFERNISGTTLDSMLNSVRKYSLVKGRELFLADDLGLPFLLAPNPGFAPPALFVDRNGSHFISLSTQQYRNITPAIIIRSGVSADVATASDTAAPLHLNISETPPSRTAYEPTLVAGATGSTSLFATLMVTGVNDVQTETPVRFFFEQQVTNANDPRVQMTNPTVASTIANFIPAGNATQNGWVSVIADLDGTAPGAPDIQTSDIFVNNPGYELVLTTQPDGSGTNGKNWVYAFRYNQKTPIIAGTPFYYFTRQLISGKVVAAGDIVADEYGRQELLVVHEDSLFVLQLKPYSLPDELRSPIETQNRPFYYLDTFAVGSSILSVAIADLEGDGENDVVICTADSTYALGKIGPDPYEFSTNPNPFNREYCPDDTLTVAWKRNVGSEDTKVEVHIIGESLRRQFGQSDILGDQVTFIPSKVLINSETFRVQPGEYRIVVNNLAYPYIADTSDPFTIVESSVSQLKFANAQPYEIGAVIRDTITLACIDTAWVQRSIGDSLNWTDAPEAITRLDAGRLAFADMLICPEVLRCGADEEPRIYYRIVTTGDTLPLREVRVSVPKFTFDVQPGGASLARRRTLEWNAADFPCTDLTISLSGDNGKTWSTIGQAGTVEEIFEFTVPDGIDDFALVCIQCSTPEECGYGVQRFAVSRVDMSNYIYPNPFDPEAPSTGGGGAEIVYSLQNSGIISITVYDASRSVVQEIVKGEERNEGRNRGDFWDGKNSMGQNVANGTYICVISSSSGEQIILPIAVVKRR